MAQAFDITHELRFDLAHGTVNARGGEPRVVVPAHAMSELCGELSDEALTNFGHALGTAAGRRVADRLGRDASAASVDTVLEYLGGELALMGLGSLEIEVWGEAMVFKLSGSPLCGGAIPEARAGARLLAGALQAACARAFTRETRVVPLANSDGVARFVVCHPTASGEVTAWLGQGCNYGEVLVRLNELRGRS